MPLSTTHFLLHPPTGCVPPNSSPFAPPSLVEPPNSIKLPPDHLTDAMQALYALKSIQITLATSLLNSNPPLPPLQPTSLGKRYLHSTPTISNTFSWAPIALAAVVGGSFAAMNWDDANAAEGPLTVESWKKSLETVLRKNPEDMDLDHFLSAVEAMMATVNEIPREELEASFEQVHRVFVRLSAMLVEMEIYEGALRFQEHFVRLCESHEIGAKYPEIYSYALNDLGETYWELKDTKKAASCYQQNIRFNEQLKRRGEKTSISSLLDLQLAYGKLALCQASDMNKNASDMPTPTSIRKLTTLQQNLIAQISQKDGCKPSKKIIATISSVNTLLELANILLAKGKAEECLDYFREASEICAKFQGFDAEFLQYQQSPKASSSKKTSSSSSSPTKAKNQVPSLADTRDNIELSRCACFSRLGRHQEAEQLMRDLLKQQLTRVGANSALLIPTYNNLGFVLSAQRKFAESEAYLMKGIALTIQQKQNTQEYAEKAFDMQYLLAGVLLAQHKHDQAIDILQKNLTLGSRIFGSGNQKMVETYAQLGFSFKAVGELQKSLDFLAKAYQFGQDTLPPSSPMAFKIGSEYAFSLAEAGNFKEAERVLLDSKTGIMNSYGTQSLQHAVASVKMALLYEKMGDYAKAESAYTSVLRMAQKLNSSPLRDSTISNTEVSLGKIFMAQRRMKEAKSLLDSGIARLEKGETISPQLAFAFAALSQWYLLSNQPNQALVSIDTAWERLNQASAPLDGPEAIHLQFEVAELHLKNQTPQVSIERLVALSSTVQASQTLTEPQKKAYKEKIDAKLKLARQQKQ